MKYATTLPLLTTASFTFVFPILIVELSVAKQTLLVAGDQGSQFVP